MKVEDLEDLVFMPARSDLRVYLSVPEVRDTFLALKSLCGDIEENELEEQVALTCAEAVRYAYKMGRELGIDKSTFMSGLDRIVDVEDREYRSKHYN